MLCSISNNIYIRMVHAIRLHQLYYISNRNICGRLISLWWFVRMRNVPFRFVYGNIEDNNQCGGLCCYINKLNRKNIVYFRIKGIALTFSLMYIQIQTMYVIMDIRMKWTKKRRRQSRPLKIPAHPLSQSTQCHDI